VNLGQLHDEPIDVYHATDAVSNSKLNVFRRSPELYRQTFITKEAARPEPTKAIVLGSALHAYLNEGQAAFLRQFVFVAKDAPRRPSITQRNAKKPSPETLAAIAYWDGLEQEAREKKCQIISADDLALTETLLKAIARNDVAVALLTDPNTRCEVTFRKAYKHFAVQCRADAVNHVGNEASNGRPFIVDLKTTPSLHDGDFATFEKSFQNYGYHRQAAFYREVVAETLALKADQPRHDFYFLAVEKDAPFEAQVYPVSEQAMQTAHLELYEPPRGLLVRLHECYRTNTWPRLPAMGKPLELTSFYVTKANQAAA
jgi:exodeoxyribonuclease VIII